MIDTKNVKATLNITGNTSHFQIPFVSETVKLKDIDENTMELEISAGGNIVKIIFTK